MAAASGKATFKKLFRRKKKGGKSTSAGNASDTAQQNNDSDGISNEAMDARDDAESSNDNKHQRKRITTPPMAGIHEVGSDIEEGREGVDQRETITPNYNSTNNGAMSTKIANINKSFSNNSSSPNANESVYSEASSADESFISGCSQSQSSVGDGSMMMHRNGNNGRRGGSRSNRFDGDIPSIYIPDNDSQVSVLTNSRYDDPNIMDVLSLNNVMDAVNRGIVADDDLKLGGGNGKRSGSGRKSNSFKDDDDANSVDRFLWSLCRGPCQEDGFLCGGGGNDSVMEVTTADGTATTVNNAGMVMKTSGFIDDGQYYSNHMNGGKRSRKNKRGDGEIDLKAKSVSWADSLDDGDVQRERSSTNGTAEDSLEQATGRGMEQSKVTDDNTPFSKAASASSPKRTGSLLRRNGKQTNSNSPPEDDGTLNTKGTEFTKGTIKSQSQASHSTVVTDNSKFSSIKISRTNSKGSEKAGSVGSKVKSGFKNMMSSMQMPLCGLEGKCGTGIDANTVYKQHRNVMNAEGGDGGVDDNSNWRAMVNDSMDHHARSAAAAASSLQGISVMTPVLGGSNVNAVGGPTLPYSPLSPQGSYPNGQWTGASSPKSMTGWDSSMGQRSFVIPPSCDSMSVESDDGDKYAGMKVEEETMEAASSPVGGMSFNNNNGTSFTAQLLAQTSVDSDLDGMMRDKYSGDVVSPRTLRGSYFTEGGAAYGVQPQQQQHNGLMPGAYGGVQQQNMQMRGTYDAHGNIINAPPTTAYGGSYGMQQQNKAYETSPMHNTSRQNNNNMHPPQTQAMASNMSYYQQPMMQQQASPQPADHHYSPQAQVQNQQSPRRTFAA